MLSLSVVISVFTFDCDLGATIDAELTTGSRAEVDTERIPARQRQGRERPRARCPHPSGVPS
jgi:hypothetical protein